MRRTWCVGVAVIAMAAVVAQAQEKKPEPKGKDVVATAKADPELAKFVKALEAADMTKMLEGAGPFTIFAPNDAAWEKMTGKKYDELLKDKAELKNVLMMHIVKGKHMEADLKKMKTPVKAEKGELTVAEKGGALMVDGAKVVKPDVAASNGVIHVIDGVVMGKEMPKKEAPKKEEPKK